MDCLDSMKFGKAFLMGVCTSRKSSPLEPACPSLQEQKYAALTIKKR
jgi:hypothetical protein